MLLRVLFIVGLALAAPDLGDKICDNLMKAYDGAVLQMKEISYPLEKKIDESCGRLATAANTQECKSKIISQFKAFLEIGRENILMLTETACKELELSSWASDRCSATVLIGLREFGNRRCQRTTFKADTVKKRIEKKFGESMDLINIICGNGVHRQGSSNGDKIMGIFNDMNKKLDSHVDIMTDMVCVKEEEALCKELTGWSDWLLGKISQ